MSSQKPLRNRRPRPLTVWLMLRILTSAMLPAPVVQALPLARAADRRDAPPGFEANLPGNSEPVLTAEEPLWQQIEAAYHAGDRAALTALTQELAEVDLPAAIRLARRRRRCPALSRCHVRRGLLSVGTDVFPRPRRGAGRDATGACARRPVGADGVGPHGPVSGQTAVAEALIGDVSQALADYSGPDGLVYPIEAVLATARQ